MATNVPAGPQESGGSTKDPDHEAETPAPTLPRGAEPCAPNGPNTQGNDRGERVQDAEGQQGGTLGGSKK